MVKNKKHIITLLSCILLPTALHSMRSRTSQISKTTARPISTQTTTSRRPQPEIKFPTAERSSEQQSLSTKTQTSPIRRSSESSERNTPSFRPSFTSPKQMLTLYEGWIENAKEYKLPVQEYESLIDAINENQDFTEEESKQLALKFNQLKATTELKKLTLQLNDLIKTAQNNGISKEKLDSFKQAAEIDIDVISELGLDTLEIFSDKLETNINELEALIKEHANTKKTTAPETQKTPEEITEEQRIKELLEAFEEETEQEKIARENREAQEKQQKKVPRKIRIPKEIKESPLKEFTEKEQLRRAQEAAEQKAAKEQAELAAEKLQKEVDQLYKDIEKEFTEELQAEQMRTDTQAHIKYIEQEQAKATASKEEQQQLIDEITRSKAALEQIEHEQQNRKTAREQLQKEWQDKQAALNLETQKETEASIAQQKIESVQRKKELEKAEAASLQAKREAMQAEQNAQKEQQQLDIAIIKTQQAQNALQAKEKSLADEANAIEQLEEELAQLKNKHQSTLQAMNEAKSQFTTQKQQIETQAQAELEKLNQEATAKIQETKDNLQKSQDFIAKTAQEQMTELDSLEKKHKEDTKAEQQKIHATKDIELKRINQKYQQELRMIEAELNQFMEQQLGIEKIKAIERRKELEKAEAASLQAKREAMQAEQSAQEEQEKLKNATIKNQQAQSALQAKQKSLAGDADAINKLETELAQLKNKHQSTLQAMNEAKSQFTAQKQQIETQAQTELEKLNKEATTTIQQAKDNLQKSQDFIAKTAQEQMTELDSLEKKYKEGTKVEQQKIHATKDIELKRINQKYEQELRMIEAELNQFMEQQQLETEKTQAEERKKEEEKREKERQEREKEKKVEEMNRDGAISQPTQIEQPDQSTIKESNDKDNRNTKPNIPIIPHQEIPMTQETKETILPLIIPENPSIQRDKEQKQITEEPIYQTPAEQTYPAFEQPTYYPMSRPTATTPRWSTPTFSSYSPESRTAPFMPSISYGNSTPSSAESIGWTSSDNINPYTQRIEWQPRFPSQEETIATEAEKSKKIQPQDTIWWEQLVPKWVVQYLGRKDRNLPEQTKTESLPPINASEEEKPATKETGIVNTIIKIIKKPLSNAVSYVRGLFNIS